jgi:Kef-type K+ transport system membrane component KefB
VVEYELNYPFVILIIGGIIVLTMVVKSGLDRTSVPALVGYLLLGFLIRLVDVHWDFMSRGCSEILGFLAKLGLVTLLFRVGLESNLRGLLRQLRRASTVWIGDVLISGLVGFLAAFYVVNLPWITSLIVATAFTATSVGISVAVWEEAGALQSINGELLIDVAEMDDISAVVFMAMLFSVLPTLQGSGGAELFPGVPKTIAVFLLKLIAFGGFCFLFSRFAEKPVTAYFRSLETPPDPMLVVVAIGFMIASLAALLGFSLAIGAFFAGLVFSRDQKAVKMEASFLPIYELFSPFFFIGIGLDMDPGSMGGALGIGAVLVLAAVIGKMVADGIPVWRMAGVTSGILIGTSMIPRAEIAMVIMQRGLNLGDWAVPGRVFGAMVLVSAVTCLLSPLAVHSLLSRWPQREEM